MAAGLKQKLDKVLHRREKSDDRGVVASNAVAPSPAVLRTSEDKRLARDKSSSLREKIRSRSRSRTRPISRNGAGGASGTPRSPREYTAQSPPMPKSPQGQLRRSEDHRDLSSEFKQLELGNSHAEHQSYNSGHQHVVSQYNAKPDSRGSDGVVPGDGSPRATHFASPEDPYSESVADFNIKRDETILSGGLEDQHAIRKALERQSLEDSHRARRSRDVNRDVINVRTSNDLSRPGTSRGSNDHSRPGTSRESNDIPRKPIAAAIMAKKAQANHDQKYSLGKPLPSPPQSPEADNFHTPPDNSTNPSSYLVRDSSKPINLAANGINLTNTVDTTTRTTQAPAVVHETITVNTHEHITESITREIHTHDVYHRILPIIDIEVLPPRHFIQTPEGVRHEIPAAEAPGGVQMSLDLQRVMQEAVNQEVTRKCRLQNAAHYDQYFTPDGRRKFTAVDFDPKGAKGDLREAVADNGVHYSERTWVHWPVVEEDISGTRAFHLDGEGGGAYGDWVDELRKRSSVERARMASVTARKPVLGDIGMEESAVVM